MRKKKRGKNPQILAEAVKNTYKQKQSIKSWKKWQAEGMLELTLGPRREKVNSRTGRQLFSCRVQKFL